MNKNRQIVILNRGAGNRSTSGTNYYIQKNSTYRYLKKDGTGYYKQKT